MMLYPVVEIFRSLQGEGHFVGYPMTFLRLAGCSVTGCAIRSRCDEAPWKATKSYRVCDIVETIQAEQIGGIVCVTGGEPTDHNLLPLLYALQEAGYRVHLETSGVRSVNGYPLEWITVSPKENTYVQRVCHTLKIVVLPEWGDVTRSWGYVAGLDASTNAFHRYLQPLYDGDRPVNLPHVIEMLTGPANRNQGARWALSTQAHKGWALP